jgi:site-specific recombinase XerD
MPDGQRIAAQLTLFAPPQSSPSSIDPPPAQPRYLIEAVQTYIAHLVSAARATHTVQSTALDLQALQDHLGDIPLVDVVPARLQAHVQWLRTERGNSSSSLRRKIATLKTFFRFAVTSGWIVESPAAPLIYPPPKRTPVVALEPHELASIVEAATHDRVWHALVLLFADTGLKRDELLALRAEDLYIAREPGDSRITVRHTAQAKRARRRSLVLTPRTHFALARLLQTPLTGGPLFTVSVRGVNFILETVGRRAGISRIKKLTPEILRDTFAVGSMRQRLDEEHKAADLGTTGQAMDRLRLKNDAAVLEMLGLSRYSDMASRYRAIASQARGRSEGQPTVLQPPHGSQAGEPRSSRQP